MIWLRSTRGDPAALPMADRHYNRQKPGSSQFVPPGRCIVLIGAQERALWVSSWPQHRRDGWGGAWVNTLFRREEPRRDVAASAMIRAAVAHTRAIWQPPEMGLLTYVNPAHVPGVLVRGERIFGFCYLRAGFRHIGFSGLGLWAWHMDQMAMPEPLPIPSLQGELWPSKS